MRRSDPLIVGGGPAGSAAAITLARGGARPTIIERQRVMGDALCGGFLSWHTLASLERLGLADLGGHPIDRVRIFAGGRMAEAALPGGAVGMSRRHLDTALLAEARRAGAGIEHATVRHADALDADAVFLATGKHDLRGLPRPRVDADDPTLGLRIAIPPHPGLAKLISSAIELHLFDGGYAGLLLQENGHANLCLAVRKSRLAQSGGRPDALLADLAARSVALGARMAFSGAIPAPDAIAAVPYGWCVRTTTPGLFRLGDQAAVIPSLAGEGVGIALASGIAAGEAWLAGGPAAAPAYQRAFAARARRPVDIATWLWHRAEARHAGLAVGALRMAPFVAGLMARATRI